MSSLSNAIALLRTFSRERPEWGVTELSARARLPKSTVSRLMAELERAGFVERTESRRYRPGPELLRIGSLYKAGAAPVDRIDAEILRLVRRFPASGYVAINRGLETVVLRTREGTSPIRFIVPEGSAVPAFTVAIGKAILARHDDAELEALLPERLCCADPFYDNAKAALMAELREGRRRGWLGLRDMAGRAIDAVAVAIRPDGGEPIGLALSFMATTPAAVREAMRDALLGIGATLGAALGDEAWRSFSLGDAGLREVDAGR